MARKRERGKKGGWLNLTWLKAILPLLLGGAGAGGYTFKDHPVVAALVRQITGQAKPGDPTVAEAIAQKIAAVKPDPFTKPGDFRVELTQIAIDPATIGATDSTEVRVVVVHYGDDAKREVLWQSPAPATRYRMRGQDTWVAAWEDASFSFRWLPGDRVVVEVWERRGLRPSKVFEYASASKERLPLATGDHPLTLTLKGAKPFPTEANTVTFDTRPIEDRAARVARDGDSDADDTRSR
jgi:hypothetical protein